MEQKELFKEAIELFEAGEYDKSVQNLIGLYEHGYEKEQILNFLYQAFVEPNIEEFKKNYQTQADGLIDVEYEATQLDFIPVSDQKFYIWYKEEQRFVENIDLNVEAQIEDRQRDFQSLLIAQTCDIREMIPFLLNKQYNTVYIVLNKNKEIFASFLKLPKIREYFLENAIIFENTKIMQLFFEEYSEFYIPRSIIAKDSQEYVTFFKDLHKRRLLKKREKNNVFLTIGIPSYNRGKILLENVKQLLNLEYDAEIEIVVSNNGSKIEADYYDQISKINDSRLVYTSFEANQGYASNVLNVMTHASGHFLVMCSDEDFLVLDKLSGFIQFLFENLQMAMSYTGGYGSNFENGTIQMYPAGIQAIECAVNSNYLTGLVFNNSIISKYKIIEKVQQNRGNLFVEYYVHSVIATIIAQYGDVWKNPICLWESKYEKQSEEDGSKSLLSYMKYESRVEQMESAIKFMLNELKLNLEEQIQVVLERIVKTYYLLYLAYLYYWEESSKLKKWDNVCTELFIEAEQIIDKIVKGEDNKKIKKIVKDYFIMYLTKIIELDYKKNEQKNRAFVEVAKYLCQQGMKVQDISYDKIVEEIDGLRQA
jgi:hypothetical protein